MTTKKVKALAGNKAKYVNPSIRWKEHKEYKEGTRLTNDLKRLVKTSKDALEKAEFKSERDLADYATATRRLFLLDEAHFKEKMKLDAASTMQFPYVQVPSMLPLPRTFDEPTKPVLASQESVKRDLDRGRLAAALRRLVSL
jgi:hypothetical protein